MDAQTREALQQMNSMQNQYNTYLAQQSNSLANYQGMLNQQMGSGHNLGMFQNIGLGGLVGGMGGACGGYNNSKPNAIIWDESPAKPKPFKSMFMACRYDTPARKWAGLFFGTIVVVSVVLALL